MTPPDDPPKKPPRASWETPDPDEAAPVTRSESSKSKPTSTWTPPPVEEPPVRKKASRAEAKPPRASWETPDAEETAPTKSASTVSGTWDAQPEPSVVVSDQQPSSGTPTPSGSTPTSASRTPDENRHGAEAPSTSGAYAAPSASGAYGQPTSSTAASSASGAYEQPTSGTASSASGAYEQPTSSASGAYEQPTSGTAAASVSRAYEQPTSGAYAAASASGAYDQPAPGTYEQASGTYEAGASGAYTAPSDASGTFAVSGAVVRPADSDDPLAPLPTVAADNTLRAAVGAKLVKEPRRKPPPPPDFDDDDGDDGGDGDGPKRKGRGAYIAIFASLVGVLGLGIGALVIFGNMNKQKFMIACEPQEVHAKQGRGFPPWGERSIDDEGMWKPIKIPPEAECRERETEDQEELSRWYLDILVERASSLLTAREVTKIDEAAGMLDQALLHARSPDRREQRRDIERLLGDVGYWRASAKLKDASTALTDAAKQFDAAAAQRPRHVSDASAWATYVRKLVDELRAGPNGASTSFPPTPPVTPGREPAPPGVALPVEPGAGSGTTPEPTPAPPDAGLPTGGVLL